MDLRAYYRKIRKIESGIEEPLVVIVSRETPDGGKAGVKAEIPRALAARMIAEERAELATPDEATQFRAKTQAAWKIAQAVLTGGSVRAVRSVLKPQRKS